MTILLICLAVAGIAALIGIVDPCSLDSLIDGSACIDNLSDREKVATSVFYLCATLNECLGEEDCTIDGLQESVACLKELSPEKLLSIDTYSDYVNAIAAGARLEGTDDERQQGIKCLKNLSDNELYAMQIILRCRLQACLAPIIT